METLANENKQERAEYFLKIAEQLKDNSNVYNTSQAEDIYLGCQDVSKLFKELAKMYLSPNFSDSDIEEFKSVISGEFKCVISDLELHFESYTDEITQNNIIEGKAILEQF